MLFGERLSAVRNRIQSATEAAARSTAPRLLAVSKSKPATTIAAAIENGLRDFGENYLQEALEKQKTIQQWLNANADDQANSPTAGAALNICWHYIGNVQSNKTRLLAENFDWVHTVSSQKQLNRLNAQRPEHLAPLNICLQVNIDAEPQKQGISADEALQLAMACQDYPKLTLRGLMCIPAQHNQAASFAALAALLGRLRDTLSTAPSHTPNAVLPDTLSMGMSGDLEAAITAGSTVVRIGSALFGERS